MTGGNGISIVATALSFILMVSIGMLLLLLALPFALVTLVLGIFCYGSFLAAAKCLETFERAYDDD